MARQNEKHPANRPRARNIVVFSALIFLMFCVVIAYQALVAYEQATDAGEQDANRLARSLSNHVELTFLSIDLTLRRALEQQHTNNLFGGNIDNAVGQSFSNWVKETPQISGLIMTDDAGIIDVSAVMEPHVDSLKPGKSMANARFYMRTRDAQDESLIISQFMVEEDKPALLVVSRPILSVSGDFQGVIAAVMDPGYFIQFFHSVERGEKSFMSLISQSGELLISGTSDAMEERLIVERIQQTLTPEQSGVMTEKMTLDATSKIFAFRRLDILPVTVVAVTDEADYLGDWGNDRVKDLGFLAMFAIFGSVLSYFALTMVKQIRRVEESEQTAIMASQAKSEFLANMSHELRTPLNAIIGFSEMMDAGYFGELNEKQKERIHDINLCGNHLLQLINDILEFSKGEAGKMELHEEEFDFAEIVDECHRIIGSRVRMKDITLEQKLGRNLPTFYGDKRKVRQLLLNLLTNAVKYTPEKGTIATQISLTQHNTLEMDVADTGIGMREEDIPKALSVFGQVHRTTHPEGTGLGLPLCRMFAELHGGSLEMHSKLGKGTVVSVSFPADRLNLGGIRARKGKNGGSKVAVG